MMKTVLRSLLLIASFASAAGTCVETPAVGDNGCFNLTAYGWTGIPPVSDWEGSICASMPSNDKLDITYNSLTFRRMWGSYIWVGTDIAELPRMPDGKADTAAFPYGAGNAVVEQQTYTDSVQLDSAGACNGNAQYNLLVAAHTTFGDPCVPPNGDFQDFSDDPAWGQDVENFQAVTDKFTWITIPIKCDCGEEPVTKSALFPAPPKQGSGSGDPHFKTWTGEKYDYHGECDLVLVDNPSFEYGLGLKLHIRTTRVRHFSFIEKVALQIGEDVLEFANDAEKFLVNGEQVAPNRKHHKTMLGGFQVRRDPKAISVRLQRDGTHGNAKIDFYTRNNGFPAVVVDGGDTDAFRGSLGLLGDWETGKTLARDGVTMIPIEKHNATAFALEWQVRDTEPMLFKEARYPQFPTTCTPPAKDTSSRLGSEMMRKEAEKACSHWKKDMEDCIFDVMATRDIMVAEEGHIVTVS